MAPFAAAPSLDIGAPSFAAPKRAEAPPPPVAIEVPFEFLRDPAVADRTPPIGERKSSTANTGDTGEIERQSGVLCQHQNFSRVLLTSAAHARVPVSSWCCGVIRVSIWCWVSAMAAHTRVAVRDCQVELGATPEHTT